jgi:DNA mismatch repair ATPase MutS
MNECGILSEKVLSELLQEIRKYLAPVYKVWDSIAFLDMMLSFATYVTVSNNCIRPEFTLDGPLVIKQGRHPVMERLLMQPFVPNDTYCSEACSFQV